MVVEKVGLQKVVVPDRPSAVSPLPVQMVVPMD